MGKKDKKETILEEAQRITSVDRNNSYGAPEDNFTRILEYWQNYLWQRVDIYSEKLKIDRNYVDHIFDFIFNDLNSKDVAMMMALLKVAREVNSHKRDNLTDLAGYIRCASKIEGDEC